MIDYIRLTTERHSEFTPALFCQHVMGSIDTYRGELGDYAPFGYSRSFRTTYGQLFDNPDNARLGVCYQVSGTGLQQMYSDGLTEADILKQLCSRQVKFTRLDYAFDVIDNENATPQSVYDYLMSHNSRNLQTRFIHSNTPRAEISNADTCYLGSRRSSRMLRVYDKAKELRQAGLWTRIELELKHKRANLVAYSASGDVRSQVVAEINAMCDWSALVWFSDAIGDTSASSVKIPEPVAQPEKFFDETVLPWLKKNMPFMSWERKRALYELAASEYRPGLERKRQQIRDMHAGKFLID